MSWSGSLPEEVVANRRRYFAAMHNTIEEAVAADQVHGASVARVTHEQAGLGVFDDASRITATDGLMTDVPGLILTTLHADCAPVFYADVEHKAVGLAHAGRRGILAGLPGEMLRRMRAEFGTNLNAVRVAVGPTISTFRYEVTEEIADSFAERFGSHVVMREGRRAFLDLIASLAVDLRENGLPTDRLPVRPPCTATGDQWSSYRRDGDAARSMMAWLVIRRER